MPYTDPRTRQRKYFPNRGGYVEEDGRESITEDFSNNIEYYLFDPGALKVKTPKVFA